jgi:hypothetical protein
MDSRALDLNSILEDDIIFIVRIQIKWQLQMMLVSMEIAKQFHVMWYLTWMGIQ